MMPDLSGVDVLKFIRSQPRLAATPVVVLTNAYLNDLGRQAATIGIQKALLKAQCSPSVLMACIDEILEPKRAPSAPAPNAGGPHDTTQPSFGQPSAKGSPHPTRNSFSASAPPRPGSGGPIRPRRGSNPAPSPRKAKPEAKASAHLLAQAPTICADLRKLFQAVAQQPRDASGTENAVAEPLPPGPFPGRRRGAHGIRPTHPNRCRVRSFALRAHERPGTNQPFGAAHAREPGGFCGAPFPARRRIPPQRLRSQRKCWWSMTIRCRIAWWSRLCAMRSSTPTAPKTRWLPGNGQTSEHFDLILLDIEMPVLNGFELCKRLRAVPGYEHTPVIFVTVHSDFESRAKSSLSGGDDLIAKPILPMELAAKVVMHLLKRQMPA